MVNAVIEYIAMSGEVQHFLVLLRSEAEEILPIVVDSLHDMAINAARADEPSTRPHTHELRPQISVGCRVTGAGSCLRVTLAVAGDDESTPLILLGHV